MKTFIHIILICSTLFFNGAFAKVKTNLSVPESYGIYDLTNNRFIESKHSEDIKPIASLTKLMTANVFTQNMPNSCYANLGDQDVDTIKNTHSRLPKNEKISCIKLLNAMLVSSDNMAAFALSRSIPNFSREQFITLMNEQAKRLHMTHTHFVDPAGLNPKNVSTVEDLSKLIQYSVNNPIITGITSQDITAITKQDGHIVYFKNSNKLVRELGYKTTLSKTGHINESGYNLIYSPKIACNNKNIAIISLDSPSSNQRCQFAIHKLNQYNCNL